MSQVKVEVGQYRPMDKGALKAFFSLVIYPQGLKVLDCKYFEKGDQRWFSFPTKEVKYTDGRETKYMPYLSCLDKEYYKQLQDAVLEALKTAKPEERYAQAKKGSESSTASSAVQDDPFPVWY